MQDLNMQDTNDTGSNSEKIENLSSDDTQKIDQSRNR